MATLDEVLALAIDGYDLKNIYDGEEQITKESITEFWYYDPGYWESQDAQDCLEQYGESYAGRFGSLGDFAFELADILEADLDSLTWPFSCIDWERAGRELIQAGDYWESEGYYFRSY